VTATRIRTIVNLESDTTWGHRVSVLESAEGGSAVLTSREPESNSPQLADFQSNGFNSAAPPDVANCGSEIASTASAIIETLSAHASPRPGGGEEISSSQSRRVVWDLPHSFWSSPSTIKRLCALLRSSVPGVRQHVELDFSVATSSELSIAELLISQGIAGIVARNTAHVYEQLFGGDQISPAGFIGSATIIDKISNGMREVSVVRAALEIIRHLGAFTIALDMKNSDQAQQLRDLGCQLGIYADPATQRNS